MSLALALGADDIQSFNEIRADISEDLALDLERVFGGLVHVRDGHVQFIHNTFPSYLLQKHQGNCSTDCILCVDHHATIARVCLNYLSMMNNKGVFQNQGGESEVHQPNMGSDAGFTSINIPHDSLLTYAVKYWPVHYQKASAQACKQRPLNFDRFFDSLELIDVWADRYWHLQNPLTRQSSHTKDTLSIATETGCSELVTKLLSPSSLGMALGIDSNALSVAIEQGHADLVRGSLKRAIHPQALHIAASHGRVELFPTLTARPWSTTKGSHEYTPLHNASESGNIGSVEEILQHCDESHKIEAVNHTGGSGETALHEASRYGHVDVIKRLLRHADPNLVNSEWKTPLHLACLWQQPSAVEALLREKRTRVDAVDGNRQTAIHFAADAGRLDILKTVLSVYTDQMMKAEALQLQDDNGRTPLHLAAMNGHDNVVREILTEMSPLPGSANIADDSGSTALHVAAEAGNYSIIDQLLNFSPGQISVTDRSQNIPVYLAVSRGYTAIVERLCKEHSTKDASLNVFNSKSFTPLHLACEGGYTDIVRILLEHHAEAEITGPNGETPLLVVCRKGYDDIALLLLESFADPMGVDDQGSSPLHLAAREGSVALVRLLLSQYVDVDQRDKSGRVPIHLAAKKGNQEIVETLLSHDADPAIPDEFGRSLLHYACEGGNKVLVEFLIHLLGEDALIEVDDKNQTLLHAAAWAGQRDVVQLLLSYSMDRYPLDKNNQTPLDLATNQEVIELLLQGISSGDLDKEKMKSILLSSADKGYNKVVEMILSKDVDPNAVNTEKKTPLHLAALGGHEEIANFLLNHASTTPDKLDDSCRTPLSYAAESGCIAIVQAILKQKSEVDPDSKDAHGQTPLHYSAGGGHVEVVREIMQNAKTPGLQKDTVNINGKNNDGMTPLWLAAIKGHYEAVKTLLSFGADPNVTDPENNTLLHLAARKGWPEVALALMESEKFKAGNTLDQEGRTALFIAAFYGRTETFSAMISSPIRLDSKIVSGGYGWQPLQAAYDSLPIVRLILKHTGTNDIDFSDQYGETALYLSIKNGYETVAKELLQNGASPLKAANNGTTTLHRAAERKGAMFFPFVLNQIPSDKDVNIEDNDRQTPFFVAVQNQNVDAVRALLQRDSFSAPVFDWAGVRTIEKVIETGNADMLLLLIQHRSHGTSDLLTNISEEETRSLVLKAFKTGDEEICKVVLDNLPNAKAIPNEVFDLVVTTQPALAGILLAQGVDPRKADKHGWPLALIWSTYKTALGHTADTTRDLPPPAKFREPSSWSIEDKHRDIELLGESGAPLGVKSRYGKTIFIHPACLFW